MRPWLVFAAFFYAELTTAQFNETVRTDRPGQAIGAFAVGQGIFQVQSGFDYYKSRLSDNTYTEGFLNNTVMRFGLTEPFEVSALVEYRTETIVEDNVDDDGKGLSALDVGMRYHIYTGEGIVPSVGFQIRARLPVLGDAYQIDDLAPDSCL